MEIERVTAEMQPHELQATWRWIERLRLGGELSVDAAARWERAIFIALARWQMRGRRDVHPTARPFRVRPRQSGHA